MENIGKYKMTDDKNNKRKSYPFNGYFLRVFFEGEIDIKRLTEIIFISRIQLAQKLKLEFDPI
jgi:hypothetical protein